MSTGFHFLRWARVCVPAVVGMTALVGCQRLPGDPAPANDPFDTGTDGNPGSPGGGSETIFNCDPTDPTACPAGQKCTPLSKGENQNFYDCVDDPAPLQPFEACTPDPVTGVDSCAPGLVCLADFSEQGRCVALCTQDSHCQNGLCLKDPLEGVPYCADDCIPFSSSCRGGLECRRANDRNVCQFALEEDTGFSTDECSFRFGDRGCAEGFACLEGVLITGCIYARCCARFCDLEGEGTECTSPDSCNPAFDSPAPTFETIGACYVPS